MTEDLLKDAHRVINLLVAELGSDPDGQEWLDWYNQVHRNFPVGTIRRFKQSDGQYAGRLMVRARSKRWADGKSWVLVDEPLSDPGSYNGWSDILNDAFLIGRTEPVFEPVDSPEESD